MKIEFWCDNGANIHSKRKETFDTSYLGLTDDEWMALSEEEKTEHVKDWAFEKFDYGFKEV